MISGLGFHVKTFRAKVTVVIDQEMCEFLLPLEMQTQFLQTTCFVIRKILYLKLPLWKHMTQHSLNHMTSKVYGHHKIQIWCAGTKT